MLFKILLSGDGGQGIQLLSDIICRASFNNGWHVSHIPNYGLEQRGGVSLAFIQISDKEIAYPKFSKPDVLLVMSEQARERTANYRHEDIGYWILDICDYAKKLEEQKISYQSQNIFFLGLIARMLEEKNIIKSEEVLKLLEEKLGKKVNWEENKKAFEVARDIGY